MNQSDDQTRLAAAKLWLVSTPRAGVITGDMPYLAHALYALTPITTENVESIAADEHWRLYVNPGWLSATAIVDIATRLAHLTWHLLADHANRARSMHVDEAGAAAWQIAAEISVGEQLACAGLAEHGLPVAADFGVRAGRSAEEHYAHLHRLAVGGQVDPTDPRSGCSCGSAADGRPRPYEAPPGADLVSVGRVQANELRAQVAIAYRGHPGSRGDQPGEWLRFVATLLDPVVPWPTVLAASVRRAAAWSNGHADYSYARRSRRQQASPRVIFPGLQRPLPKVVIVIDTSASMDDGLLGQALGEVQGALAGLGVAHGEVGVVTCDAAVQAVARVRHARDIHLGGGGGTDLRHGIDAATKVSPRPEVLIVLTDGDTPWPDSPPPGLAVIAAVLGRDQQFLPPTPIWVQRVECFMT